MFKKIDVSSYLRSAANEGAAANDDEATERLPKHEPTYSAAFGFGFGEPKLMKSETRPRDRGA